MPGQRPHRPGGNPHSRPPRPHGPGAPKFRRNAAKPYGDRPSAGTGYRDDGPKPGGPKPGGPHRKRPHEIRRDAQPHQQGNESDRLQKVLAHAGVGSRRACEEFILQGRVTVNGKIVKELGTKVAAGRDKVSIDGEPIRGERPAYIAVNKPKGYVSTNADPSGRPRVIDLVPDIPQRVYTVGRLDEMSTGLLLLTNDGELANRLAHPKFGVEKIYRAVVAGTPSVEVLQKLTEGVWLAEGKVRAKRVKPIAHKGEATVLEMVLAEGKNREVRRMLSKLGHKVMALTRVAVGPVTLRGLKPGGWRFLTAGEVELLRRVADGLPVPQPRYGTDHDITPRPPTRGPNAPGRQGANRDTGTPPRDRFVRDPRQGASRGETQDGPPRPRPPQSARPQGTYNRRPLPARQDDRPDRREMQDGPRPPQVRPGAPRPPQDRTDRPRPPQIRTDGPRPQVRPDGPRPPQVRTDGPGNRRPMPPRPPREEAPSRKIIGLNVFEGGDQGDDRRPPPRKRPGTTMPRPRPPAIKRRRPDEGDGGEGS